VPTTLLPSVVIMLPLSSQMTNYHDVTVRRKQEDNECISHRSTNKPMNPIYVPASAPFATTRSKPIGGPTATRAQTRTADTRLRQTRL
jgi:hypothetical protein